MEKKGYCYRWDHKYNQHDIYVGSTENDKAREARHRSNCYNPNSREYNKPFYKNIRKYGTIDHWKMTIIYKGPNYKLFEKNFIKSTWEYNLNDNIPLPTEQEKKDKDKAYQIAYQKANRNILNERSKAYRLANKDIVNAKAREKIECKICGAIVTKAGLSDHRKSLKCSNFYS